MTFVKTAALSLVLAMGTAIPHVAMAQQSAGDIQAACLAGNCAPSVIGLFEGYSERGVDEATLQATADVSALANSAIDEKIVGLVETYIAALEALRAAAVANAQPKTIELLDAVIAALKAGKRINIGAIAQVAPELVPLEASAN